MELLAIASRHLDRIADDDVFQEGEMRVTMRRIDGDPAFAGVGRPFDMPGTEGERLAAAACQRNGAGVDAPDDDSRGRGGISP